VSLAPCCAALLSFSRLPCVAARQRAAQAAFSVSAQAGSRRASFSATRPASERQPGTLRGKARLTPYAVSESVCMAQFLRTRRGCIRLGLVLVGFALCSHAQASKEALQVSMTPFFFFLMISPPITEAFAGL